KKSVDVVRFSRKLLLESLQISIKVGRDREPGTVRKVEGIHRIHLYPFCCDSQVRQQRPGDRGGGAEQRREMSGGVKRITVAAERAAVATYQRVLLHQQHLHPRT